MHDPEGDDLDVVGLVRLGERVGIALLRVRAGRLIGTEAFSLSDPLEGEAADAALAGFLRDCYAGEREIPPEVIVPAEPQGAPALCAWLGRVRGARVRFTVPRAGAKKALLAMAGRNAMRLLQEEKAGAAGGDALLEELGRIAGAGVGTAIAGLSRCVEPFGDRCGGLAGLVGGWCAAAPALPPLQNPSQRRARRFRHARRGRGAACGPGEFGILDGSGRGAARRRAGATLRRAAALSGAPWQPRLLLAIAKPNERRGTDAVFIAGAGAPLALPAGTPVLLLLQRVRDEAHRFAVAYHRSLRSKRLFAGPLAGIPGLGAARQSRLLTVFGGLAGVRVGVAGRSRTVP